LPYDNFILVKGDCVISTILFELQLVTTNNHNDYNDNDNILYF